MIHEDTDVIFPPRIIPLLMDLRENEWYELVEQISDLPSTHPKRLAFVFLMTKLCGCSTCHADSFRAMRGCTYCSTQAVKRNRGDDRELIIGFDEAFKEIQLYLENKKR